MKGDTMAALLAKLVEYPGEKVVEVGELSDTGRENAIFQCRELLAQLEALEDEDEDDA